MTSTAMTVPPASSAEALAHFEGALQFETDCWDVHFSMTKQQPDFVLLDVRSPEMYARGHVPGAIHLPHGKIIESKLANFSANTNFVVYCAGPHCNGAHRGAIRLAQLERPVKIMIGGITGWIDEGFALATGIEPGTAQQAISLAAA